jgi:fatty acid desaturase
MKRRRDDPYYVRSALATLAFYAALLGLLAIGGWTLGWRFGALVAGLFLWMYRGALFGLYRWPPKADVERLLERERETLARRAPEGASLAGAPAGRATAP